MLETKFASVWGCLFEVSLQTTRNKLDPRTISGYIIGYVEKSKGYIFYCISHNTRVEESKNAKFFENDLISRSNQF